MKGRKEEERGMVVYIGKVRIRTGGGVWGIYHDTLWICFMFGHHFSVLSMKALAFLGLRLSAYV